MIYNNFKDFVKNIPNAGRLLGVDWGARRIGIAVSDESRRFVFTRDVIAGDKGQETKDNLLKIITDENIVGIVIGLPLYADGTESDTTKRVRDFSQNLCIYSELPIGFCEENLTSVAAEEYLGKNKKNLDSESAKIILENAIAMINRK